MQSRLAEFAASGATVLAVAFVSPAKATAFIEKYPLPFTVLVDPDGSAYRQFELGRTSWMVWLRPDVLWRYLQGMWRGTGVILPTKGADLLQLGGDFVIDAQGIVRLSHPSTLPTDRCSVDELLAAVQAAANPGVNRS